ncbi:MAG: hypothetical protein VYD87_18375 [Pseudomonadota bacterium]|nr:hypothetical protein [Pseudomonadota bacterium]MEE3100431.1 hypothetical protein [Pseudomonadota bacterium]
MRSRFAAALLALPLAGQAQATPVALDTWYTFGFSGAGSSLSSGSGYALGTNPSALAAPDPAWTFLLPSGGGTLTVVDLFISSDRFMLFDFGSGIGSTGSFVEGGSCDSDISCALADSRYSRGVFSLGAGSHSITGQQTEGAGGAAAFMVSASGGAPVPLPAAFGLQAGVAALLAGGALLRRRRGRG